MQITIDPSDLTLGEVEFLEEESGLTLDRMRGGEMTTKAAIALVCIMRRREDPAFTMDDARKVKLGEFDVQEPANPTGRAKKPSRR